MPTLIQGSVATLAISTLLICLASLASAQSDERPAVVEAGSSVSLEYKLTTGDGVLVHSNVGEGPVVFVHGDGRMLPALEQAMLGMSVGDSKSVRLSASEAYGEPDPALVQSVPLSNVPEEQRVAGAQLLAQSPTGERRVVEVKEVKQEQVVIDFNHPLAGHAVQFDISIVALE